MIKKLLSVMMILTVFIATPLFVMAQENEDPSVTTNANIERRASRDNLPVFFVKGQEIATYEYEGEDVLDFRRYFNIWDQRTDILKMNNRVDGAIQSIDLGGYVWDFSGFDVNVLGKQEIKVSYTGISGVTVVQKETLTVIENDVTAPVIYGLFGNNIDFDLGQSFETWIASITAVDNVDGVIELTLDNFEGYETIETGKLNSVHEATLTVSDKAGNVETRNLIITLKDRSAPVIYNTINIETKKNKPIDYKSHVYAKDNLTEQDKIKLEFQVVTDQSGEILAETNEVDFKKVGEYYIKVIAEDESGLTSSAVYRVIVKDSISLMTFALIINAGVLVVGGTTFGIVTAVKASKNKKEVE